MKKLRDNFFIFTASLIIGILISTNVNMNTFSTIFNLNSSEYKDAANDRNQLYEEISSLKEENYDLTNRINSYNNSDYSGTKIVEDMNAQLEDYTTIVGVSQLVGPGIVVRIDDGKYDLTTDSQDVVNSRTLHDMDAAMVINELRYIGAEAIAINSYRILNNTGIMCNWAFIGFDDENMETAPFYFYAIGDPEQLEAAITAEGSYINELIIRELNVEITRVEEITINATSKNITAQYMKRADE